MKRYQKNENYMRLSERAKKVFDTLALPILLINNFQIKNEQLDCLFGFNETHLNKVKKVIEEFKANNILIIETEKEQTNINEFKSKRIFKLKGVPEHSTLNQKLEWFYKEFIEEVY